MDASTNNFIIVSYYTPSYKEVADKYLLDSLTNIDVQYAVIGIGDLGNWYDNTAYKPTFALEMLDAHPDKDIVIVDCDARIETYPELFDNIPEEYLFAAHYLDHDTWYHNNSRQKEFLSGTLFIRNCEKSRIIIEKWKFGCLMNNRNWEQYILQQIIENESVPVYHLPISYCYIDSLPNGDKPFIKCDDVVVRHFQYSRKVDKNV